MKIRLAIFDLAGTTVKDNQDVPRVLQQSMAKFGVMISMRHACHVMGIPKPVAIRYLLEIYNHPSKHSNDLIEEIHAVFIRGMIDFYTTDFYVGETEGTSETFRALKKNGVKIAVDTGFDRLITQVLLDRLGWIRNNLIDCSVTSDEVERGRPFPDMIFKAMQIAGITKPEQVAKIGDTISDMQEGKAAGCGVVVGITSGVFSRQILQAENPTHLIDSIPEVLAILNFSENLTST